MIPDSYDMWEHHERMQEIALERLPVCHYCDKHIQDDTAYYINGEWICLECMELFCVPVDDYID